MSIPFMQPDPNRLMREQEDRDKAFQREQMVMQQASSPHDDAALMQEIEQNADLVRWQEDLDDEIATLKHKLKREIWNSEDGWRRSELPPLLNDKGIAMIEEELEPLTSRNMILSNLAIENVMFILRNTSRTIRHNLMNNFDAYGMDPIQYRHIMRLIKNAIIPAPFRALNNGERGYIRTFNKRVESFSTAPRSDAQPQRSILGIPLGGQKT